MTTLSEQVNIELGRLTVQGEFRPCLPDQPCENCGCPMRGHADPQPSGVRWYATQCHWCPCRYWSCRHGGVRCPPGEALRSLW